MSSNFLDQNKDKIILSSLTLVSGLLTSLLLNRFNNKNKQVEEDGLLAIQNKGSIRQRISKKDRKLFVNKIPKEIKSSVNSLLDELKFLQSPTCEIEYVDHIYQKLNLEKFPQIESPLWTENKLISKLGGNGFIPCDSFIYKNSYVISTASFNERITINQAKRWLRAGPRRHLFFNPEDVKACIVTCGGLCPGLNAVIREIVLSLNVNYNVNEIFGIQFGYRGFYTEDYQWLKLTPEVVKNLHEEGGTFLGSSRGGFDAKKIVDSLVERGINQVYIIGGDGTHAGILKIHEEICKRGLYIVICGLPKTIDNDIPIIDSSFGFETSVQEAQKAIMSGYVESHCAEYGVGLIRLMGRDAGFIAMTASLASRVVNVCLVPEFQFELYGEKGVLQYVYERLQLKRHCVIVVAEGAGAAMKDAKIKDQGKDASGHVKAGDIGNLLKDELIKFCKEKGMDLTLKYIDPTYMIRSVPANSYDQKMCQQLAAYAVHGLMAGFTGFSVGHVNNKLVYLPIREMINGSYLKRITADLRDWQRLMASTGQPAFINKVEEHIEQTRAQQKFRKRQTLIIKSDKLEEDSMQILQKEDLQQQA